LDSGLPSDVQPVGIVVSPSDPDVVYVMARSHANPNLYDLYVTRDGAASWQLTGRTHIVSVIADLIDPDRVYLQDDEGNLWVSTDYATTVKAATRPPVVSEYFGLYVDPGNSRVLYALGASLEVAMSTDRGTTWQRIVEPSPTLRPFVSGQVLSPGLRALYLGSAQGVLKLALPAPELAIAIPTLDKWSILFLTLLLLAIARCRRQWVR
jgi:hypothetical protein